MDDLKIRKKDVFFLSSLGAFIASLCCFTPLILFLVGLSTASFASGLADIFYGQYKWIFRLIGLLSLLIAFIVYLRNKEICTLDQVKRQRNKIINIALIVLISSILLYFIWLYVVVEYAGVFFGLWK